jgi:general transcription factor 3C polypeptide 3 (transcription factor C subunit 4)
MKANATLRESNRLFRLDASEIVMENGMDETIESGIGHPMDSRMEAEMESTVARAMERMLEAGIGDKAPTTHPGNLFEQETYTAVEYDDDSDEDYYEAHEGTTDGHHLALADEAAGDGDLLDLFSESELDDDDDEFQDWSDSMDEPTTSKKKNKGRTGGERELRPEVQNLINEASHAYSNKQHEIAIKLAEEAISVDKNARLAYTLLGTIYEDMHDMPRSLAAKVAACHLNKKSYDDWMEVGRISEELNLVEQAVAFYGQAAKLRPLNYEIRIHRGRLLMQQERYTRVIEVLNKVRSQLFESIKENEVKSAVLLDIASALEKLGRREEAIDMYEEILNKCIESPKDAVMVFNFQDLNTLVELYHHQKLYTKAIKTIKKISRWILGREDETWWDDFKDDSEFDERRRKNRRFQKSLHRGNDQSYNLPIDLRVWLLLCRLESGRDFDEALEHVRILRRYDAKSHADLYQLVGGALQDHGKYREALELLACLEEFEEVSEPIPSPSYILLRRSLLCLVMLSSRILDPDTRGDRSKQLSFVLWHQRKRAIPPRKPRSPSYVYPFE